MISLKEMDYVFFIERAKERMGFKYDNELDAALGFKASMVTRLRKNKAHLSDQKMLDLAEMAGVSDMIALSALHVLRSEGAAKKTYKKIFESLSAAVIIAILTSIFVIFPPDDGEAQAAVDSTIQHSEVNPDLYIITLQDWQNRPSPGNGPGRRYANVFTPDLAPFRQLAVLVWQRPDALAPWR